MRPFLHLIILSVLEALALAQDCQNPGDACDFHNYYGSSVNGFCNDENQCGQTGSPCFTNDNCYDEVYTPNPCSGGMCGGIGASCEFAGQCTSPQFCAVGTHLCQSTCPDGSPPDLFTPSGIPCTCSDGYTYNSLTNMCGCPANSYANPPSSAYPCTACPAGGTSDAASTSCTCSGISGSTPQMFSVVDGVPSCCPTESIPNPSPRSGGPLCSCKSEEQTYNPTSLTCDCPPNTFGSFTSLDDTEKNCIVCPPHSTSTAGANICTCDVGHITLVDQFGDLTCLSCPSPESSYNQVTGQCRCLDDTKSFNLATNTCVSSPTAELPTLRDSLAVAYFQTSRSTSLKGSAFAYEVRTSPSVPVMGTLLQLSSQQDPFASVISQTNCITIMSAVSLVHSSQATP